MNKAKQRLLCATIISFCPVSYAAENFDIDMSTGVWDVASNAGPIANGAIDAVSTLVTLGGAVTITVDGSLGTPDTNALHTNTYVATGTYGNKPDAKSQFLYTVDTGILPLGISNFSILLEDIDENMNEVVETSGGSVVHTSDEYCDQVKVTATDIYNAAIPSSAMSAVDVTTPTPLNTVVAHAFDANTLLLEANDNPTGGSNTGNNNQMRVSIAADNIASVQFIYERCDRTPHRADEADRPGRINLKDSEFNVPGANLVLEKTWQNATVNDSAEISISGGQPAVTAFNSMANTSNETDTAAPQTVLAGHYTFSETISNPSGETYIQSLSCSGAADTDVSDSILSIDAADDGSTITCTYLNRVNDMPIAVDESAPPVLEDSGSVNYDVLANGDNFGGDGASTTTDLIIGAVTGGTATLNDGGTPNDPSDDTIDFVPAPNFNGTATVEYTLTDADGDTATATLTIPVTPVNDTPVAVDESAPPVLEDNGSVNYDVLANGDNFGGDGASTTTDLIIGAVTGGTATLNDGGTPNDPSDDTIDFVPAPNFNGTATVEYTLTDADGDTATATLTIPVTPVNDTPVAVDETAPPVLEDSGSVNYDVLANGDNFGGDGASTTTDLIIGAVTGGTATLNDGGTPNDPSDDTIDFVPAPNFNGTATVEYTLTDADGDTATATLKIPVTPVNDTPVAVDEMVTVNENSGATIINVLANDSFGADGAGTTAVVIAANPSNGSAVVNDNGTPNDPSDDTISYTPNSGFTGTDTLMYTIEDANGDTSTATVTITVTANDVAQDDTAIQTIGQPVTIDVTSNDSNVEPTTVQLVDPNTGTPSTSVTIPGEGIWTVNTTTGEVTFTPVSGFTDTPTPITYQVTDNNGNSQTATVFITTAVMGTDANDDNVNGVAGQPVYIPVVANDASNVDPATVQLLDPSTGIPSTSVTIPGQGTWTVNTTTGEVIFTPESGFTGNPSPIDYQVENNNGILSRATITVTYPAIVNPNVAPIPINHPLTLLLLGLLLTAFGRRRLR